MKVINIDGEIYLESTESFNLKYSYIKTRKKLWVLKDKSTNLIPVLRKWRKK